MTGAFDDALVSVILADYIGVDSSGKYNIIGSQFLYTAIQPTGTTTPMSVGVIADLPHRYVGKQVGLSLELIDLTAGEAFRMAGPNGSQEALRAEQMFTVDPPTIAAPGFQLPQDIPCRLQLVMAFPIGLPLVGGRSYEWRARVEGARRKGWVQRFSVLAPVPPPVFGGHGGPSDIPQVSSPAEPDDDVADD